MIEYALFMALLAIAGLLWAVAAFRADIPLQRGAERTRGVRRKA